MMAHKDWVRWVFASAADYFKRVAEEQGLPVLVEGLDARTEAFLRASDRAEVRITGPFTQEVSKGCYKLYLDVNVLLVSRYDGDQKNAYSILNYAGAFQAAMGLPIGVWNYGSEAGDYVEDDLETQASSAVLFLDLDGARSCE